jgi:hypothetical protein
MIDQVERLYVAAKALRDAEGVAAIARLLEVSPQTVNNWGDRPISDNGLLKAQQAIGCDALWLRDGTGEMIRGKAADPDYSLVVRLMACFAKLPGELQEELVTTAETLLADIGALGTRVAGNKAKR